MDVQVLCLQQPVPETHTVCPHRTVKELKDVCVPAGGIVEGAVKSTLGIKDKEKKKGGIFGGDKNKEEDKGGIFSFGQDKKKKEDKKDEGGFFSKILHKDDNDDKGKPKKSGFQGLFAEGGEGGATEGGAMEGGAMEGGAIEGGAIGGGEAGGEESGGSGQPLAVTDRGT